LSFCILNFGDLNSFSTVVCQSDLLISVPVRDLINASSAL